MAQRLFIILRFTPFWNRRTPLFRRMLFSLHMPLRPILGETAAQDSVTSGCKIVRAVKQRFGLIEVSGPRLPSKYPVGRIGPW